MLVRLGCLYFSMATRAAVSPADDVLALGGSVALPGVTDPSALGVFGRALAFSDCIFLSASENNSVAVLDAAALTFTTSMALSAAPNGMSVSPSLGLFVAAASDGSLTAWSTASPFHRLWSVNVGQVAVSTHIDDISGRAYVGYAGIDGGRLAVLDLTVKGAALVADIPIEPDSAPIDFCFSPVSNTMMVSAPSLNGGAIRVVDRSLNAIVDTWPNTADWVNPGSLRIEPTGLVLYVATQGDGGDIPARLVVLDARDGTLLWSANTAPSLACAVELGGDYTFALCGGRESSLWVVHTTARSVTGTPTMWAALGAVTSFPSASNAQSLAFSDKLNVLFVAVPFIAADGQQPRLLKFVMQTSPASTDDDDTGASSTKEPSVAVWAGAIAAVAVVSVGLGFYFGRVLCPARSAPDHERGRLGSWAADKFSDGDLMADSLLDDGVAEFRANVN